LVIQHTISGRCRRNFSFVADRMNFPFSFQSMSWHLATAFDFQCNHVLLYPISTSLRHQKNNHPGNCGSYPRHFFLEFFLFFFDLVVCSTVVCFVTIIGPTLYITNIVSSPAFDV
jgi:hypothetical protein